MAIPKGSLEEATFALLGKAWTRVSRKNRTYRVFLDDSEIIVKMLRPQEIPTMVAEGLYDIGITGNDWVGEAKVAVDTLLDLEYGKIKLVAAYPESYRYANLDAMIADYAKKKRTLKKNTLASPTQSFPVIPISYKPSATIVGTCGRSIFTIISESSRNTLYVRFLRETRVHALPKRANVASSRLPFGIAIRTFIYTNIISHTRYIGFLTRQVLAR